MGLLVLVSCAPLDEEADSDADLPAKADDARVHGVDPMSLEACAMLQVANAGDAAALRALGVPGRAAASIARYRAAEDGALGTTDDRYIASLPELDAIPDVGSRTMQSLPAAASGIQCGGGMIRVQAFRTGFTAPGELWGAFRDGDGPWRPLPETGGALVFPVADAGGRYSFALRCYNESNDWGRVAGAISTWEMTAAEARDLVLDRDLHDWSCGSRLAAPGVPVTFELVEDRAPDAVGVDLGRETGGFDDAAKITIEPPAVPTDLVVTASSRDYHYPPDAALVQRGLPVAAGLTVTLERRTFTDLEQRQAPVRAAAPSTFGWIWLRTATDTNTSLSDYTAVVAGQSLAFAALPPALAAPGDLYIVETSTFPTDYFNVSMRRYVASPDEVVYDVPPMPRPGGTWTKQPDGGFAMHFVPYPGAAMYAFDFLGRSGPGWILARSAARVALEADATLPSFAGVRGWNPKWQLAAPSAGVSVLVIDGGDTAAVFQPSRRAGMTLTILKQ